MKTQNIVYKEEKIIKKKNNKIKNIVFSQKSLFLVSINEYDEELNINNVFVFGYLEEKWKCIDNFKEKAHSIDIYFLDDYTYRRI